MKGINLANKYWTMTNDYIEVLHTDKIIRSISDVDYYFILDDKVIILEPVLHPITKEHFNIEDYIQYENEYGVGFGQEIMTMGYFKYLIDGKVYGTTATGTYKYLKKMYELKKTSNTTIQMNLFDILME